MPTKPPPLPLMTLEEMDALGIPRETVVIESVPARRSARFQPSANAITPPGPQNTNADSGALEPQPPKK